VSDYRNYRVLIGDSFPRRPISGGSKPAQALLVSLYAQTNRATARVAIGQQLITYLYGDRLDPNAWNQAFLKLQQGNYPLPEIMGGELSDLVTYPGFNPNQDALNELIRHGHSGNMVTLVWHPDNPAQGDFNTPVATSDLKDMVDMNTATGRNFQAQLDLAGAVLRQFQDATIPILFRPFHEQNGNFFWWGDDGSSGAAQREREAAWVAMWRKMVADLTVNKGLSNLLFVFCANQVDYDGVTAPMAYYPGGYSTDVVSMDVYNDQLYLAGDDPGVQHYAAMIATGKPFGLSEFGQAGTGPAASQWDARTLAQRVRDSYPRTTFATAWYSATEGDTQYVWALPDVSHTRELLTDPWIYTQPH
jgi:mannan endo-1,4-beta-mannosidase